MATAPGLVLARPAPRDSPTGPSHALDAPAAGRRSAAPKDHQAVERRPAWNLRLLALLSVVLPAVALRVWDLNVLGFNSDEAVYAGQAASIAGDSGFLPYFPVFRAHPLLFQTILSLPYRLGVSDLTGRLMSVAFGLATVGLVYLLGRELYGRKVGYVSALLFALMPYHVVVSRQVLLDGPMTFFAVLALYLLARFAGSGRTFYLYATAGALGLTVLSKEVAIILVGAAYAFLAMTAHVRVRMRSVLIAIAVFVVAILPFPLSVKFSGRTTTGEQFLAWQLFRRPNHTAAFYAQTVPGAIGILVLAAAIVGLVGLRRRASWRETLLLAWILVPVAFFELWPVKGFQYLLPVAAPVAVLAARALVAVPVWGAIPRWPRRVACRAPLTAIVAASLLFGSVGRVEAAKTSTTFLAGAGGVPGGREAGRWVGENVPDGARLLALGPSMANIIQFYGHRKTFGLSVSPNPLHRNPVYEPVVNADLQLRRSEIQYLVWDSYSASRSKFFSDRLLRYVERYHGREVHTEYVQVTTDDGHTLQQPTIIIYEVRP